MSFGSVLVANRGEIARRVFATAKRMGVRCTAVYVDADADALFVAEADAAIRIDSYLDADAIVAAARTTGTEAVHPGYGFLSEQPHFAQAVIDAGLIWIGPSPEVIQAMGDKLEAKQQAVGAGVPTLPSTDDLTALDAVGYPLLLKAAAGGGGKGMRIVNNAAELADAATSARREALNGFGDDRIFAERYVPAARHIEIQIMGDRHGTVVAHGERECSIQRRHQKIVEEAPAPGLETRPDGADIRAAMEAASIRLAEAMHYESAGTVEFLFDDESGEFFFLEVNTRLQVEHPVTEEARGIDLVREQFRIAMGEPATSSSPADHAAIEVRLYAEDPANDFLPAIGTLHAFEHPSGMPGFEPGGARVRWDVGVAAGSDVTVDFDPMLGKVISRAPSRHEAARGLAVALEDLHLGGVTTNVAFLANTLRSEAFIAGATTTDFIAREQPSPRVDVCDNGLAHAAAVGSLWIRGANRSTDQRWGNLPAGFRTGRLPPTSRVFEHGDRVVTVAYQPNRAAQPNRNGFASRDSLRFGVGTGELRAADVLDIDLARTAQVVSWNTTSIRVDLDGMTQTHRVTRSSAPGDDRLWVQMPMGTIELAVVPDVVLPGSEAQGGGFVAPMPGVVLEVRVAPGDLVTKGQTLVILEAMKMEHHMTADADGEVAEVRVAPGQQVAKDTVLLTLAETMAETMAEPDEAT